MLDRPGSGSPYVDVPGRIGLAAALLAVLTAAAPEGRAVGPTEHCATVSADRSFPDGRPHVWKSTTAYGTSSCTNGYVVDVTYSALAPLPGTYLSWGDAEPSTQTACVQSALKMYVWDLSGAQPAYLGATSTQGAWIDNDDTLHNPGAAKLCHVPPVRAEAAFQLASGKKYRFAMRAERQGQNQGLIFANAPVPSRKGGNAAGSAEGLFLAIPKSPAARDANGWLTEPFAVKLESPDRRVARGGDLVVDGTSFFKLSQHFAFGASAGFGLSNAMLLPQGTTGGLTDITCPSYAVGATDKTYTYTTGWEAHGATTGARYCLLGERNDRVFKLKVFKADAGQGLVLVGYLPASETGRRTWGCLDGLCDGEVRIATQFTKPTETERVDFVGTALDFLRRTRSCLDAYLQRPLPVPLALAVHGEKATTSASLTHNYGMGGTQVTTTGFEGLIRPGETRVNDPLDLRYELHEPMHVYNRFFFADGIPSWLDEGYAIQAEVRVGCGGDPRLMMAGWRGWKAGDTDGHTVGSEFFKRLEASHGCGADCAAQAWRDLVDTHGADTYLTDAEIKAVFEARTGADLTPLFTTLGLEPRFSWFLPSSARTGGQGGAFYTTDLTVVNRSAAEAAVTVKFLGHDGDGRGGDEKTELVGAGEAVTFGDVLGSLFALPSGYGGIRVSSTAPLIVQGQTSTPGPSGGSFGQSVPAISEDDLIGRETPRSVAGVREDGAFRTNLILANASKTSHVVNVALVSESGSPLGSKSYTLPPLGMTQVTEVVRDLGVTTAVRNAVLLLSTVRIDAMFTAYASVIDRTTNDPRTLLPAPAGEGGTWILPSSARTGGQGGAFYTTQLTLANRTQAHASVTLKFLGHDVDGRGGTQKVVDVPAGKAVTWADVLGEVFGVSTGYGAIRVLSPSVALNVLGQTSTPGPSGGTFGQSVPASAASDLVTVGVSRSIAPVREDGRFRTNLILANAMEAPLVVEVRLLAASGALLDAGSYTLPPLGMRQVTEVVRDLGVAADVRDARLVLSTPTPGGAFAAYASVIDRTTNDPRTLLPR